MAVLPYLLVYLGVAVFVVAVAARFVMWSKMPMHVRWELYPVAHEGGGRAAYGGSYLEVPQWWTAKREVSLWGELKAMVPEMVFLVALKEHNRRLWTRSFPFHFGLYLVAACTALLVLAGLLGAVAPELLSGAVGRVLGVVIPVTGVAGLVLGLLGALGLLHRRLSTPELRLFSAPADFFNLILFVGVLGVALVTFLWVDRDFALVSAFVANLVTLELVALPAQGAAAVLPALSAVLLAALTAYIPLTHMSHFVGKYFAYHAIRWNDTPNLQGGEQEGTIQGLLGRPVSWAAPHIKGDGRKSWADVATEDTTK